MAVLVARAAPGSAPGAAPVTRSEWSSKSRLLRSPLRRGPGAWRASALPASQRFRARPLRSRWPGSAQRQLPRQRAGPTGHPSAGNQRLDSCAVERSRFRAQGPYRQPRRDRGPDRASLPGCRARQRRRLLRVRPRRAARDDGRRGIRAGRPERRARATSTSARYSRQRPRPGADAVHPGYGFLAEHADFAREVIAAGLTWIGPPPEAIDALGDKVRARHIARVVGAPLAAGTDGPVSGEEEAAAFAAEHGLPIAIKAAYGGGGRGLKVARTAEEIAPSSSPRSARRLPRSAAASASWSATWTGPRHVETQCLADAHGNIVVVSTRDCSLQRRHQKLVEEAPAPFLTQDAGRADPRVVQGDPARGRLRRRGHLRVPGRPGRLGLVPGGEHQAAGRAPGDRGGQRYRPGAGNVPHR